MTHRTAGAVGLEHLLAAWLPRQRWFAQKGSAAQAGVGVRLLGVLHLPSPRARGPAAGAADVAVHVVAARVAEREVVYQVPLVYRAVAAEVDHVPSQGHVGLLADAERGTVHVYDGPHDPAYVAAWFALTSATTAAGPSTHDADGHGRDGDSPPAAHGVLLAERPVHPRSSRVLGGEQSNTSVVVEPAGPGGPLVLKVFRVLHDGPNPDVVVQVALARAGCDRVPGPYGAVQGSWTGADGRACEGHLSYTCEFLAGSEDAWRVAGRAVDTGEPFADQARALGEATAQVHAALAAALPTRQLTSDSLALLADGLLARVEWAQRSVPALAEHASGARAVVDGVRSADRAAVLQQVHGDYHLGQVLHSPQRGWVLLDFEGEPLRPLAERGTLDLALRDVAGMLRSFDYVAARRTQGLAAGDPRTASALAWATDVRTSFLEGYAAAAGRDPRADAVLLRALELDKALYEAVYEAHNRPDWLEVPLAAVRRLLAPAPDAGAESPNTART